MTLFAWANCIGGKDLLTVSIDYLSITSFAAKGHASTAIAGVFSGQLFNYLVGFGGSLLVQSLDGELRTLISDKIDECNSVEMDETLNL